MHSPIIRDGSLADRKEAL